MGLYGAVEAGGTKFVCAVASGPEEILSQVSLPTETPAKTLGAVMAYFRDLQQKTGKRLDALGIGTFGPIDLDKKSSMYGYITATPKPGWVNTEFATIFEKRFKVPVGFDTDVNGAAYGEYLWGAGRGLDVVLYLTVGTGIGGGLYVNGKPLHGLMHPEMGHVLMQQDKSVDAFEGTCPFHKGCMEGLASGKAVDLRWKCHASELADDHAAWDMEAGYLAQGLMNYILTVSPQKIIIGGGLMHKKQLYPLIRAKVKTLLNGYVQARAILDDIDNYIVSPGLGTNSGIIGAIGLAMAAAERKT
ncbi:MAG: fructokinase [Planctomycetes bacterium GWF2_50_10]|nr:MAG: fructokinase [Planctomycetes bacterium GWF2_50_10]